MGIASRSVFACLLLVSTAERVTAIRGPQGPAPWPTMVQQTYGQRADARAVLRADAAAAVELGLDWLQKHQDDVLLLAITGFTGGSSQFVAVPANGALVGQAFYSSWVVLDDAAPGNPAGLVSTNAPAARIRL